jgi:hypothetical protein
MENLIDAYKGTKFMVFDLPIVIEIDKKCRELDELLNQQHANEWAYITAWNPFSKTLPDDENDRRHLALTELLQGFTYFEGEGVGSDASWKPEKSLLILSIPKTKAIEIGKIFEQNAIVCGRIDEPAELICMFDFE